MLRDTKTIETASNRVVRSFKEFLTASQGFSGRMRELKQILSSGKEEKEKKDPIKSGIFQFFFERLFDKEFSLDFDITEKLRGKWNRFQSTDNTLSIQTLTEMVIVFNAFLQEEQSLLAKLVEYCKKGAIYYPALRDLSTMFDLDSHNIQQKFIEPPQYLARFKSMIQRIPDEIVKYIRLIPVNTENSDQIAALNKAYEELASNAQLFTQQTNAAEAKIESVDICKIINVTVKNATAKKDHAKLFSDKISDEKAKATKAIKSHEFKLTSDTTSRNLQSDKHAAIEYLKKIKNLYNFKAAEETVKIILGESSKLTHLTASTARVNAIDTCIKNIEILGCRVHDMSEDAFSQKDESAFEKLHHSLDTIDEVFLLVKNDLYFVTRNEKGILEFKKEAPLQEASIKQLQQIIETSKDKPLSLEDEKFVIHHSSFKKQSSLKKLESILNGLANNDVMRHSGTFSFNGPNQYILTLIENLKLKHTATEKDGYNHSAIPRSASKPGTPRSRRPTPPVTPRRLTVTIPKDDNTMSAITPSSTLYEEDEKKDQLNTLALFEEKQKRQVEDEKNAKIQERLNMFFANEKGAYLLAQNELRDAKKNHIEAEKEYELFDQLFKDNKDSDEKNTTNPIQLKYVSLKQERDNEKNLVAQLNSDILALEQLIQQKNGEYKGTPPEPSLLRNKKTSWLTYLGLAAVVCVSIAAVGALFYFGVGFLTLPFMITAGTSGLSSLTATITAAFKIRRDISSERDQSTAITNYQTAIKENDKNQRILDGFKNELIKKQSILRQAETSLQKVNTRIGTIANELRVAKQIAEERLKEKIISEGTAKLILDKSQEFCKEPANTRATTSQTPTARRSQSSAFALFHHPSTTASNGCNMMSPPPPSRQKTKELEHDCHQSCDW